MRRRPRQPSASPPTPRSASTRCGSAARAASPTCAPSGSASSRPSPKKEPNNDFDAPQASRLNTTVAGRGRERGRRLLPRHRAKKGQRLSVEVEGDAPRPPSSTPTSPSSNRTASNSPPPTTPPCSASDPCASIIAPEDGDYTHPRPRVVLRGQRQLPLPPPHRHLPAPHRDLPARRPARPRRSTSRFSATPRDDHTRRTRHPGDRPTRSRVFAAAGRGCRPVPIRIRVCPSPRRRDRTQRRLQGRPPPPARRAPVPSTASSPEGGQGLVPLPRPRKDQNLAIARPRPPAALAARQRDHPPQRQDGKALGNNDDPTGRPGQPARLSMPRPTATYFLNIRDHLYRSGPDFTYRIEVQPRSPRPLRLAARCRAQRQPESAR